MTNIVQVEIFDPKIRALANVLAEFTAQEGPTDYHALFAAILDAMKDDPEFVSNFRAKAIKNGFGEFLPANQQ